MKMAIWEKGAVGQSSNVKQDPVVYRVDGNPTPSPALSLAPSPQRRGPYVPPPPGVTLTDGEASHNPDIKQRFDAKSLIAEWSNKASAALLPLAAKFQQQGKGLVSGRELRKTSVGVFAYAMLCCAVVFGSLSGSERFIGFLSAKMHHMGTEMAKTTTANRFDTATLQQ